MKQLCRDYAIGYLSRYPKTERELIQQLQKKGYEPEAIEETVPRLKQSGYLDDVTYARLYLSSEVARKGKSLTQVRAKLQQKGIDRETLECLADELEEELQSGMEEKLIREYEKLAARGKDERQIEQALLRRGYTWEQIKSAKRQVPSAE